MAEFDVIIVGAGISGLTAAYELKKANKNVKIAILEAQDRVGGRTKAVELKAKSGGTDAWDAGGMWVGLTQTNVLALLKDLGIQTYPQKVDGTNLAILGDSGKVEKYKGDDVPGGSFRAGMDSWNLFRKLEKWAADVSPEAPFAKDPAKAEKWAKMTLQDFLNEESWTSGGKETMELLCDGLFDSQSKEVSLLYALIHINAAGGSLDVIMGDRGKGAQAYKIVGTAAVICEKLKEFVGNDAIQLNTPVTKIWYDEKFATVQTSSGSKMKCQHLIMAIPPNQAGQIEFSPDLSQSKKEILTNFKPKGDQTSKFIATYKSDFWIQDDGNSGIIIVADALAEGTGEALPSVMTYDATTPNGNPALIGFASLPSHLSEEKRKKMILDRIAACLGPKSTDALDFHDEYWYLNQYERGAVASIGADVLTPDFPNALRKPTGVIHWAGTETATFWMGFMNGAVQAGQRAAKEILSLMSKP